MWEELEVQVMSRLYRSRRQTIRGAVQFFEVTSPREQFEHMFTVERGYENTIMYGVTRFNISRSGEDLVCLDPQDGVEAQNDLYGKEMGDH
jgi:hypothetical protein